LRRPPHHRQIPLPQTHLLRRDRLPPLPRRRNNRTRPPLPRLRHLPPARRITAKCPISPLHCPGQTAGSAVLHERLAARPVGAPDLLSSPPGPPIPNRQ